MTKVKEIKKGWEQPKQSYAETEMWREFAEDLRGHENLDKDKIKNLITFYRGWARGLWKTKDISINRYYEITREMRRAGDFKEDLKELLFQIEGGINKMRNERTITRKNLITEELETMTAKAAYREITKTAEGKNLCDEWAVENEEIFENILEGAGTLEIDKYVYSYNALLSIKRIPHVLGRG